MYIYCGGWGDVISFVKSIVDVFVVDLSKFDVKIVVGIMCGVLEIFGFK